MEYLAVQPFADLMLSVSPKAAFEHADEISLQAVNLREEAARLKYHIAELEESAKECDAAARDLLKMAHEDRSFIQAELEILLDMYADVMEVFTRNTSRDGKLRKLMLAVEEGTASVEDVEDMGEKLLRFRTRRQPLSSSPKILYEANATDVAVGLSNGQEAMKVGDTSQSLPSSAPDHNKAYAADTTVDSINGQEAMKFADTNYPDLPEPEHDHPATEGYRVRKKQKRRNRQDQKRKLSAADLTTEPSKRTKADDYANRISNPGFWAGLEMEEEDEDNKCNQDYIPLPDSNFSGGWTKRVDDTKQSNSQSTLEYALPASHISKSRSKHVKSRRERTKNTRKKRRELFLKERGS